MALPLFGWFKRKPKGKTPPKEIGGALKEGDTDTFKFSYRARYRGYVSPSPPQERVGNCTHRERLQMTKHCTHKTHFFKASRQNPLLRLLNTQNSFFFKRDTQNPLFPSGFPSGSHASVPKPNTETRGAEIARSIRLRGSGGKPFACRGNPEASGPNRPAKSSSGVDIFSCVTLVTRKYEEI